MYSIEDIVAELRTLRIASLEYRQRREAPPRLPSRKALASIVEGLCAALFPNRLGLPQIDDEGIDYYVGHLLDVTLRELLTQVIRELRFSLGRETLGEAELENATAIVQGFAKQLPHIRSLLDSDIHARGTRLLSWYYCHRPLPARP
jgi:serine O-acetyltransferase